MTARPAPTWPPYKAEVLYQTYRRRIRPRSHYVLGRLPQLAGWAAPIAGLVNQPIVALPGVAVRRPLVGRNRSAPEHPGVRGASGSGGGRVGTPLQPASAAPRPRGAAVGRQLHRVLRHRAGQGRRQRCWRRPATGCSFPRRTVCCGLTWITTGQLDGARRRIARTVDVLIPFVDGGDSGRRPGTVLRRGAALGRRRVAATTRGRRWWPKASYTLAELLNSTPGWTAPDLAGTTVVVQPHCHHASVMGFDADLALLARPAPMCSGWPDVAAWPAISGSRRATTRCRWPSRSSTCCRRWRRAPDAVVLADGFSCRTQLQDLADVRAVHLAQLLAASDPSAVRPPA